VSAIEVTREPLTYEPAGQHSYFRDRILLALVDDRRAQARLRQHQTEMRTLLAERDTAAREAAARGGVQLRATTIADSSGGQMSPPLWLIDQMVTAPRPGRVLAARMPTLALPAGVSEIDVPRVATGTTVQPTPDGAVIATEAVLDALASSVVAQFSGAIDATLQLLERSPAGSALDFVLLRDLLASYDAALEQQLIAGTGVNGQLLGVLNVPAGAGLASDVTYTDASPTGAEMIVPAMQACAQLGDARKRPPEAILMRTARRAWFAAQAWPQTFVAPWPVDEDDAIPVTGGQDAILALRPSDMLLIESPSPIVSVDRDSLSGTLGVRLTLRGYAAALAGRQPTAVARVVGSGMAVQPGF
jgi:hypothetical protein